jgi:hypothetical protein
VPAGDLAIIALLLVAITAALQFGAAMQMTGTPSPDCSLCHN